MAANQAAVQQILSAAKAAVEAADLPDDLRVVGFGKAVELLSGQAQTERDAEGPGDGGGDGRLAEGAEAFFAAHQGDTPAENAFIVTAFLYNEYGASTFSMDDVRGIGDDVGLTLPDRVDVTLGQAKRDGKTLFKKVGKGKLQPTVHGQSYLQKNYGVRKGTKKRAEDAGS
jgi:hypothetical protein